ncbi:hypothetical protein P3T73_15065 [Kiritimatiellota bacterium B12222]|nr:hypothetical protein P3T73_15065 [Kiritimatiellota bacterium B12222]
MMIKTIRPFLPVFLLGLMVAVSHLNADVIIDNSTANGGFESPSATGMQTTADNWQAAIGLDQFQRLDNDPNTTGAYSMVIGTENSGEETKSGALQITDHVVGSDDLFTLTFDWAAAWAWDPGDQVNWRLFTTDDDSVSGTVSVISAGFVNGSTGGGVPLTWNRNVNVLSDGGTVLGASVGQKLMLEFTGSNNIGEFARVDNVNLTVIPEPSCFVLVGLAGLAFCVWRHRK